MKTEQLEMIKSGNGTIVNKVVAQGTAVDTMVVDMINNSDRKFFAKGLYNKAGGEFSFRVGNSQTMRSTLTSGVNREKVCKIIKSVTEAVKYLEDYFVDTDYVVMDLDYSFVREDTQQALLLCIPAEDVATEKNTLKDFIKEILITAVYDTEEDLSYIGKMIAYLNQSEDVGSEGILAAVEVLADNGEVQTEALLQQPEIDEDGTEIKDHAMNMDAAENAIEQSQAVEGALDGEAVEVIELETQLTEKLQEDGVPGAESESEVQAIVQAIKPAVSGILTLDDLLPLEEEEAEPEVATGAEIEAEDESELEAEAEPEAETEPQETTDEIPYLYRTRTGEIISLDVDVLTIGKSAALAKYVISDNPAISRLHAVISQNSNGYTIRDNHSTNHVYLDGKMIESDVDYPLNAGMHIFIGNEAFVFKVQ